MVFQACDHPIVAEFRELHRSLCTIEDRQGPQLGLLHNRFLQLSMQARGAVQSGHLSGSSKLAVSRYVGYIRTLAGAALACSTVTHKVQQGTIQAVQAALSSSNNECGGKSPIHGHDTFRSWKDWFVENMDNPYATDREAASLAALTPGQNAQQFRTWLTNNRRRSGWTTLFKEHAESSKDRMRLLMSQYEDEHLSQLMPPKMYDAITEVKNYHKKLDEGRSLSGAIKKVVEEHGQITPAKKRRIRASTSGSENEGSPPESCASVSLRSSSGSSTSSPYFFDNGETPPPITGKRAREEETNYAESPSSSKRSKSSLYDMPNRPIAGLRSQQPADLFTFQPQPAFASTEAQALQDYSAVSYNLPSLPLSTDLPESLQQPSFPTFSLPPIATPNLPWLNDSSITLAEPRFDVSNCNLLDPEPLSGYLEPWLASIES